MPGQIPSEATDHWIRGLGARLCVFVFVTPFLVLFGACVFALLASQVGEWVAPIGTAVFVVACVCAIVWWMALCAPARVSDDPPGDDAVDTPTAHDSVTARVRPSHWPGWASRRRHQ